MDIQELQSSHAEHAKRVADWRKWRAVYDGTDAIIAGGYFKQHERESDDNDERRCEGALSWGISQAIVDLFAQCLFLHPSVHKGLSPCLRSSPAAAATTAATTGRRPIRDG